MDVEGIISRAADIFSSLYIPELCGLFTVLS